MSPSPSPFCSALAPRLRSALATAIDHRLTFAEYMAIALYDPVAGYYASQAQQIGPGGDFVTSPHLGSDFGELLAEQLVDIWQVLACPEPFHLVEMGAGQGLLAGDILTYLHDRHPTCWQVVDYRIIETAEALISAQKVRLGRLAAAIGKVTWQTMADLENESIVGCFFSNELVDAFPVHRVVWQSNQLQESYVNLANESDLHLGNQAGERGSEGSNEIRLAETIGSLSTDRLLDYFDLVGLPIPTAWANYSEGYTTEVNLAAIDWLERVAQKLDRGFVITIDYGYEAPRFYHPSRTGGTLQCYFRQAHHDDPYVYIGQQDMTAHVDFTALKTWGDRLGLTALGWVKQAEFLMALGLGDRLLALATPDFRSGAALQDVLQHRDRLHRLIDPMGLGQFGVLIQSKGIQLDRRLRGLNFPTQ